MPQKPWEGVHDDYEQLRAATLRGDRVPFPKGVEGWPAAYLNAMVEGMAIQVCPHYAFSMGCFIYCKRSLGAVCVEFATRRFSESVTSSVF